MFLKNRFTVVLIVLSFFLFCLASIFITFPLIFNLTNITSGFGDELIITWIQNFIIHNPGNFNGNIYFPYDNTLAYSDYLFTSGLIASPILFIFKEPLTTFNFTLIFSFIFLGFSIFILCFYLSKNYFISLFIGLMVIFCPAVLDKKIHIQILGIEWVVFSMLFFIIFLRSSNSKYLVISLIFFVLQIYNSFMPGYFILFFYFISLLSLFFTNRESFKSKITKKNMFSFIFSLIFILPIIFPYFNVSKEFNYKRDIRESIHFALQPEDFLVANEDSKFYEVTERIFANNNYPQNAEIKSGFIGIIFSLLSILFIIYFIKNFSRKNYILNSFFFTGILGFVLSLGPLMHINRVTIHEPFPVPLPYLIFYYILPGFNGFRNSARWEMLFIICFSVGIAIMLAEIFKKYSVNKQIMISLILISLIILEFNFPMKYFKTDNYLKTPDVYSTLKADTNVVFIPLCSWNDNCAELEFKRNYYSINKFPKTVNGVSGFSPPPWEKQALNVRKRLSTQKTIDDFKHMDVNYLIFEKDNYDLYYSDGQKVLDFLRNNNSIKEVNRFDNTYVFKL